MAAGRPTTIMGAASSPVKIRYIYSASDQDWVKLTVHAGASSTSQREDGNAFATQFEGAPCTPMLMRRY
jgi:hypothetical protein